MRRARRGPESGLGFSVPVRYVERFWSKVERTEGCWLWRGALNAAGYGAFSVYAVRAGPIPAHRAAYAITHGAVPHGRVVMHRCDNKQCVNPAHLEIGSQRKNARDARARGLVSTPEPVTRCVSCGKPREDRFVGRRCLPCHRRVARSRRRFFAQLKHVRSANSRLRRLPAVPPSSFDELVRCTSPGQAKAFACFYGIYDFPLASKSSIGVRLGVTRERARQLVNQAAIHLANGDHLSLQDERQAA